MGAKHPLGLWEGATENATVCQGLLTNLASRGLRTDRSLLVIVDGAKALDTAVTQTFGRAADGHEWNARRSAAQLLSQFPPIGAVTDLDGPTRVLQASRTTPSGWSGQSWPRRSPADLTSRALVAFEGCNTSVSCAGRPSGEEMGHLEQANRKSQLEWHSLCWPN